MIATYKTKMQDSPGLEFPGGKISARAARLSIAAAITVLVLLAALHVLSPEFDPSWRMVSEYANGRYGWVLALMFACWAVSTWALAFTIWPWLRTRAGKIGLAFLIGAGLGEAMASFFDINYQSLHDMAGFIGVLCLPVAAMLISLPLGRVQQWAAARKRLVWTANLTWISVVLMFASLMLLFVTYTRAGGRIPADGKSLPIGAVLPRGAIAVVGYANRFLIVVYCAWAIVVAARVLKIRNQSVAAERAPNGPAEGSK
jgi:Protein of unknown function (DUF998)